MSPLVIALLCFFVVAYLAIALEGVTRVNKTAAALFAGVITWTAFFLARPDTHDADLTVLFHHLSETSQIIFFLLGAMTIVEIIDSHHGFQIIVENVRTRSKVKMAWIVGFVTFFVSCILDNLTATIVMISLLRKIIPDKMERWSFGAIVVIAANAGGAWTPIGDVTTTMLWIHGNISTLSVMRELFLPSLVSLLVVLVYATWKFRGQRFPQTFEGNKRVPEPGARLIFTVGIGSLLFVPVFKGLTGLPPFMGILIGLALLWLATDLWHRGHRDRDHLKIPHALTRIDISGILFFLGILLAVGALEAAGILHSVSVLLSNNIPNTDVIAILIGLFSAVVDNVPLVAASISMYDLEQFPMDSDFWNMIAYCAGTGGSILIIGSAAGVAFMGLEKVDFIWYMRRVAPIALLSYFVGAGFYLIVR